MENTRTSLFQEVDTSRAEAEAAIARLEKLSASFGRTAGTKAAVRGQATVAQAEEVRERVARAATGAVPTEGASQQAVIAAPTAGESAGAAEEAAGQ
jgi:hypothetical protein